MRLNIRCLPQVLRKPLFWVLFVAMLVLVYVDEQLHETGHELPILEWRAVLVPSSLLTFFIVFYGQQSYARYYQFYGHCIWINGDIMEWVARVRTHFGGDKAAEWNATRYMLAALHVHYAGIDGVFGTHEWETIRGLGLLTREEIEIIKGYGGFKPFLVARAGTRTVSAAVETAPRAVSGLVPPR